MAAKAAKAAETLLEQLVSPTEVALGKKRKPVEKKKNQKSNTAESLVWPVLSQLSQYDVDDMASSVSDIRVSGPGAATSASSSVAAGASAAVVEVNPEEGSGGSGRRGNEQRKRPAASTSSATATTAVPVKKAKTAYQMLTELQNADANGRVNFANNIQGGIHVFHKYFPACNVIDLYQYVRSQAGTVVSAHHAHQAFLAMVSNLGHHNCCLIETNGKDDNAFAACIAAKVVDLDSHVILQQQLGKANPGVFLAAVRTHLYHNPLLTYNQKTYIEIFRGMVGTPAHIKALHPVEVLVAEVDQSDSKYQQLLRHYHRFCESVVSVDIFDSPLALIGAARVLQSNISVVVLDPERHDYLVEIALDAEGNQQKNILLIWDQGRFFAGVHSQYFVAWRALIKKE